MLISPEQFSRLTGIVIDNFESGYYHPDMALHYNAHDQALLANSGETMFGIDRKAGIELKDYSGWNEFWGQIDAADARHKWKHYYIPPDPLKTTLKNLCSEIMYGWFNHLAGKHLTDAQLAVIANDERQIINWSYACWNGESFFIRFALALSKAMINFPGNKEMIFQETIKARTESPNKLIRQGGQHMMLLFKTLHLI